jgi:hypothetical protein
LPAFHLKGKIAFVPFFKTKHTPIVFYGFPIIFARYPPGITGEKNLIE